MKCIKLDLIISFVDYVAIKEEGVLGSVTQFFCVI